MRNSLAPFVLTALFFVLQPIGCLTPPGLLNPSGGPSSTGAAPPAPEKLTELSAWSAVAQMAPGINIGNTLDNTTIWETGWGNPPISKGFVENLAHLGFKTVRLPVAWDTYADDGRIDADKLRRVGEVVDWITGAGMFCVLDIHWDGGWIDSDKKEMFPEDVRHLQPRRGEEVSFVLGADRRASSRGRTRS